LVTKTFVVSFVGVSIHETSAIPDAVRGVKASAWAGWAASKPQPRCSQMPGAGPSAAHAAASDDAEHDKITLAQ